MKTKSYPLFDGKYCGVLPGLYLGLFHGFIDEQERIDSDDWGESGALIGPLEFVHTTYALEVKLRFIDWRDAQKYPFQHTYGPNGQHDFATLEVSGDCILFDGIQYGDWTVFYIGGDDED